MQSNTDKFIYHDYGDDKLRLQALCSFESQGYTLRYDDSASLIAVGCSNGTRAIYSVESRKFLSQHQSESQIGVTCLRWRPQVHSKNKVLLLSDSYRQQVIQYLMPAYINRWHLHEQSNGVNCLDYNEDGKKFATAGIDRHIRVYDQPTKKRLIDLTPAEENHPGHSNRIFSLKFVDDNTLVSGGWDAVVHVWDLREARSVRHIVGPHISGDAIDSQGNQILTGSENSENPLQVWDLGTGKLLQNFEWSGYKGENPKIFSVRFSKFDKGTVVAGCSGTNQLKLFKFNGSSYKPVNKISNLKGGCYSVDFNPRKQQFAFTDASGCLCVLAYNVK